MEVEQISKSEDDENSTTDLIQQSHMLHHHYAVFVGGICGRRPRNIGVATTPPPHTWNSIDLRPHRPQLRTPR